MTNRYFTALKNVHLLPLIIILVSSTLFGCVTTEEFNAARELNRADNDMQQLLSQPHSDAIAAEIAGLADYSMTQADELSQQKHPHLAIGFYRIAAIGYWKDKIDSLENNTAFFKSVNDAQAVCKSMAKKAPDRDCFFLAYAPLFAAVDETLNNPALVDFRATEADIDIVQAARAFTIDLARDKANSITSANGSLTNLMVLANQQQVFLTAHKSMASYICRNIKAVTSRYITIVARLTSNANVQKADIIAENPLYADYINGEYPPEATTIADQVNILINKRVAACEQI